jgi:RNA polymerase sigma-70 factor, ECF subfamily
MDDFREFYAVSKDAVFRAVLAAAGDRHTAEDAVAEAYARAWSRWRHVSAHPNPTGWVVLTALNVCRSWWRRLRRELIATPPDRPATTRATGLEPLSNEIRDAIRSLPRRQREVVALRLLAELSAEETGAVLGIEPATVHVHLHRALAALRAGLGTRGLPVAAREGELT